MFRKILIANRGEIAVRAVQACREMGILSVALYDPSDMRSLHVRLADESVRLESPADFMSVDKLVTIAREYGVDAVYPGYGFLAEDPEFIRACQSEGITFIGPPAHVVELALNKIGALQTARAAGFRTVDHSPRSFAIEEWEELVASANEIGYPLVIKSCSGGRGPGERLVTDVSRLSEAVRRAQARSRAVYNQQQLYMERAILPAHQIGVQILADCHGNRIHLGEREGSIQYGNQKVVEESPAPSLSLDQRQRLWETALALVDLFGYENAGTVEFIVDEAGEFYFTEIKARIQVEHSLTEVVSGLDLIQTQIRLAAGKPLPVSQDEVHLQGWAMLCRVRAEDPWSHFLASPGQVWRVRFPGGYGVRVDSYLYGGVDISPFYDPLVANVCVWASDRRSCVNRMRRALEDVKIVGTATNIPTLQHILRSREFMQGVYNTDFLTRSIDNPPQLETYYRDLAVIAAVLYQQRNEAFLPVIPQRTMGGWHRGSRRLPH